MRRDDRPYFDAELGIPWDEMQFATWLMVEGAIQQTVWGPDLTRWCEIYEIDAQAAKFARRASATLRHHPSHLLGKT